MLDPHLDPDLAAATADPRGDADFDPASFPECDGAVAPREPGHPDPSPAARARLRFLAIYYRLNRARQALADLDSDDPRRSRIFTDLNALTEARDRLEDAFAPYGFVGEPVMDGAVTRALTFTTPPERHAAPPPGAPAAEHLVVRIPIPTPDDLPTTSNDDESRDPPDN